MSGIRIRRRKFKRQLRPHNREPWRWSDALREGLHWRLAQAYRSDDRLYLESEDERHWWRLGVDYASTVLGDGA